MTVSFNNPTQNQDLFIFQFFDTENLVKFSKKITNLFQFTQKEHIYPKKSTFFGSKEQQNLLGEKNHSLQLVRWKKMEWWSHSRDVCTCDGIIERKWWPRNIDIVGIKNIEQEWPGSQQTKSHQLVVGGSGGSRNDLKVWSQHQTFRSTIVNTCIQDWCQQNQSREMLGWWITPRVHGIWARISLFYQKTCSFSNTEISHSFLPASYATTCRYRAYKMLSITK